MTEKLSFDESMSEMLSGKRQPDLIVCSKKGWDLVKDSFKQRQDTNEQRTIDSSENKSD